MRVRKISSASIPKKEKAPKAMKKEFPGQSAVYESLLNLTKTLRRAKAEWLESQRKMVHEKNGEDAKKVPPPQDLFTKNKKMKKAYPPNPEKEMTE